MKNIENSLKELLRYNNDIVKSIEDIDLNEPLDEIGLNSISFVQLAVAIESEFGFEFETEYLEVKKFTNLQDIINYIEKRTL